MFDLPQNSVFPVTSESAYSCSASLTTNVGLLPAKKCLGRPLSFLWTSISSCWREIFAFKVCISTLGEELHIELTWSGNIFKILTWWTSKVIVTGPPGFEPQVQGLALDQEFDFFPPSVQLQLHSSDSRLKEIEKCQSETWNKTFISTWACWDEHRNAKNWNLLVVFPPPCHMMHLPCIWNSHSVSHFKPRNRLQNTVWACHS